MKLHLAACILSVAFIDSHSGPAASEERIQGGRQNIAKWDKNHDGVLTGAERDEFIKAKRKEAADEENTRRAKLSAKRPRQIRPRPALSLEAAQKPVSVGVPKNIEDAQK